MNREDARGRKGQIESSSKDASFCIRINISSTLLGALSRLIMDSIHIDGNCQGVFQCTYSEQYPI
jgi:hypothetical protein